MFQLCYSASDANTIRRNAMWQPLYSLSYFFIIMLGWAALLAGTAPAGGDPNAVLLQFVSDRYPAWLVGLFTGTVCLLTLVPGSVLLLTIGSIFSRNVVQLLLPQWSARNGLLLSRGSMLLFAAIAVWMTLGGSQSLFEVGLNAYAAIGMLAPGVILAFLWRPANAAGVFCGILAGCLTLLTPSGRALGAAWLPSWDPGLTAIIANAAVLMLVTAVSQRLSASAADTSRAATQDIGLPDAE
jgi:SSS family solute:Na+ symporter